MVSQSVARPQRLPQRECVQVEEYPSPSIPEDIQPHPISRDDSREYREQDASSRCQIGLCMHRLEVRV